jgi:hypothetical protein
MTCVKVVSSASHFHRNLSPPLSFLAYPQRVWISLWIELEQGPFKARHYVRVLGLVIL